MTHAEQVQIMLADLSAELRYLLMRRSDDPIFMRQLDLAAPQMLDGLRPVKVALDSLRLAKAPAADVVQAAREAGL